MLYRIQSKSIELIRNHFDNIQSKQLDWTQYHTSNPFPITSEGFNIIGYWINPISCWTILISDLFGSEFKWIQWQWAMDLLPPQRRMIPSIHVLRRPWTCPWGSGAAADGTGSPRRSRPPFVSRGWRWDPPWSGPGKSRHLTSPRPGRPRAGIAEIADHRRQQRGRGRVPLRGVPRQPGRSLLRRQPDPA